MDWMAVWVANRSLKPEKEKEMKINKRNIGLAVYFTLAAAFVGCEAEDSDELSELDMESVTQALNQFATIQGKFIDENDWWRDGHVAGATISVYAIENNSWLAGTSTNQNGYYSVSGPFLNLPVRVVATPPMSARCRRASLTNSVTVNDIVKTVDFKDECKF
jgi:hypothetical protein